MYDHPQRETRPFKHCANSGLEFDPKVAEVSILDRSGRAVWKKSKEAISAPIRWYGSDFSGQTVVAGDYVLKITYPDEKVAYLPFVFIKQS